MREVQLSGALMHEANASLSAKMDVSSDLPPKSCGFRAIKRNARSQGFIPVLRALQIGNGVWVTP